MFEESYNKFATYLIETFDLNFILFTVVITTFASIAYFVMISYFITQIDKGYFIRKTKPAADAGENRQLESKYSRVTQVIKIAKIVIGIFLILCGVVMLVLPGQGLITILIGLSLVPFPGKNQLEQKLLSKKSVRASLNWIRKKANKEPFIFD